MEVIAGKLMRASIPPGIKSSKSIVEKCALRYNEPNTLRNGSPLWTGIVNFERGKTVRNNERIIIQEDHNP